MRQQSTCADQALGGLGHGVSGQAGTVGNKQGDTHIQALARSLNYAGEIGHANWREAGPDSERLTHVAKSRTLCARHWDPTRGCEAEETQTQEYLPAQKTSSGSVRMDQRRKTIMKVGWEMSSGEHDEETGEASGLKEGAQNTS